MGNWDSELTVDFGGVAAVEETPSLILEFVRKWATAEQASCIVPSLVALPQAAPQCSKEGYPALLNT